VSPSKSHRTARPAPSDSIQAAKLCCYSDPLKLLRMELPLATGLVNFSGPQTWFHEAAKDAATSIRLLSNPESEAKCLN
jgi:hypothetical protein